ncbi:multicopper oxidase family protein [Methylomicrobium sp. Wu6]|uniref:multicopper oxidase family protein n=1 Tax=Methylomicrobium sp. Wu6 TaxID=3107928 RepID=UPI002DD69A50|nr:multicopper oxidase family protein [Methylomicrobium sp. Wu6]MEC4748492.1 multicopper oxidase family protein [Methylomicrobium sp. Wu6]
MIKFPGPITVSVLLTGLLTFSEFAAATPSADTGVLAQQLEQEFKGAYSERLDPVGKVRSFELTAAPAEWGVVPPYRTAVWAYNGTVPGPVLRIKLGETLKVKLTNNLAQSTTMHWHGIRVPNAMDGVPGVTQPPIKPGGSFTYQFTPKDAGTFWFHPHLNSPEQIERGLHGALIVEDSKEPRYSQDLVWVMDDWLFENGASIYGQFVTGHDLAHDGRWGNVVTVNGKYLPSIPVKAGERLRIRLINAANGRVFSPAFDGLSPKVIAVDGMPAGAPFPLSQFNLAPGNRLDLDLVIPKEAAGKLLVVSNRFGRSQQTLAFLDVATKTVVKTPTFEPPKAAHFPAWTEALAAPVAHEFILNAERGGPYGISWTIDGKIGHENVAATLPYGKFSRLRYTNKSGRLHPMHLHGQFFKLLAVDGEPAQENFWRDTLLVGPKQSVDVGLVPLDKGLWANHCHILEHAEAGMMSTFKVE